MAGEELAVGYSGGRITKIKILNFMTYDHVELYPRQGLNLVVGLNGSGKSSIMCAICLGLAGKPQFTGRASQLSDFIKHGCQEAEIEMELETENGTLSIIRKITADKSEWLLNRSVSNLNEVTGAVRQFNIDTSNLCQFLPQEKVVEFSRMDKKQRLDNMLQAIGEPRLFELFNELKELFKQSEEIRLDIKRFQSKKSSAEEENERISDEVQKQESRVRLKKELDELFKQKKISEYQEILSDVQQLKNSLKDLETELASKKDEEKQALALEDSISSSYVKYSRQLENLNSKKLSCVNNVTIRSNHLANFKEQVENANIEFKNRIAEMQSQKKRLFDLNQQIEGLELAITEEKKKSAGYEKQDSVISQKLSQLQQDIHSLFKQIEALKMEKNKYEYEIPHLRNQLSALQNEHNKKMENLKKRDRYTYEAACWLLENRNRFKSNVYLPIMLEIKVYSSDNCKYVENIIAFRDMIAFVCEDKSDCELFTDILSKKELPINVVMAPDTPLSNFVSPALTSEYKGCGLQGFVSDLFTAPEPVMRYLCQCYKIHCIPVSTSPVSANKIDFVLQKYRTFFAENNRISGKRSKYGNQNWSVKKDHIMELNYLTFHNDELQSNIQEKLQVVQERVQAKTKQMEELEISLREKEKNQEILRNEKKNLQDLKTSMTRLINNYHHKVQYRSKISVIIDGEEEKAKVTRKIRSINENREVILHEINNLFKEFIQLEKDIIQMISCMNCLSVKLKLTKTANEDIHDKVKAAELEVEKITKEYKDKKRQGRRLLQEIQAMGEISLLPYNGEEIEQKINHIQAQLNVDEDNELLVADYNTRKRKIESFQMEIDEFQSRLDDLKETIAKKKKEWLTPLQKHITNINKKFSKYFKQLSCVGEISLDIPDNQDDFTKYGLQIKLKFRDDEPFTELSQTHHSGGECSVTAIVFILSLQELTEVPFRCIDEINQGMDSVNERKIYQLIADSVSDDRCSQYFLLTPKLLTDIDLPNNVAVHIIFNSCYLNMQLDVRKHLEIAQSVAG